MTFPRTLVLALLLLAPCAFSEDISGFWKHVDEPGWIEINLEQGTGTVVRNDKYPDRVGRKVLSQLVADPSGQGLWKGRIYVQKLDEYKDADITLADADLMVVKVKVGFMSRTVEWQRVESVSSMSTGF